MAMTILTPHRGINMLIRARSLFALSTLLLIGATGCQIAESRSLQQRSAAGPVVTSAGAVFEVDNPDFATPMDRELKAVFELRDEPRRRSGMQPQLGSMSRYLNMHARAGVQPENLLVAGVVHAGAAFSMVSDERYREEHGVDNPNKEIIAEILAAGGQLVLCGQSAASRGIAREDLLPGVQLGLSAMTALTVLQQEGYQIITW
jgi:intracellular sulfur oxidation DsrE/DsrF family protein